MDLIRIQDLPQLANLGQASFSAEYNHFKNDIKGYENYMRRTVSNFAKAFGITFVTIHRTILAQAGEIQPYFLSTPDPMSLPDGSSLNFQETIILYQKELYLAKYAYEYKRLSGYSFRYEYAKDAHPDKYYEPDSHCHVSFFQRIGTNGHVQELEFDQPRVAASLVNLSWICGSILTNFYKKEYKGKSPS